MADPVQEEPAHRRPHTPPLTRPFLEFDLAAEVTELRGAPTWKTGRNARTLVKYDDCRVVLVALQAHAQMAEHKTDGRVSILMLSGHVRLSASGRTFDLRPGSLLALDQNVPHGVEALEESALLLTIVPPHREALVK